jgi:quercetin dioxygenase-like cupin family protein
MEVAAFKQRLRREGYIEGDVKAMEPGLTVAEHDHPCDVCALVLDGEIGLTVEGNETLYRPGDVFTMAAGCLHAERIGQAGVRYLVGRRHPAPQS